MNKYAIFMGAALFVVCATLHLTNRVALAQQTECPHEEPTHIVGSDANGPSGAPIDCWHAGTNPPVEAWHTITITLPDGTTQDITVRVTEVCPQYIWETPDHWSACDDQAQLHEAECVCCKQEVYTKKRWSVKCLVFGGQTQSPQCVKDAEDGETEPFTAGKRVECPTNESGACPFCP